MYDTRHLESLARRRTRHLTQVAAVEAEIKAELARARDTDRPDRPSEERLGGIVGVTRLTITKWVTEGRTLIASDGQATSDK
jgi:hypothetical protein